MAIYHFSARVISRAAGSSALASAAYRSASRLHDQRLDRHHDFSNKAGVIHSEVMLPENAPERFGHREALWNAVEAVEVRKDAQLAREIEFAIPRELSPEDGIALARDFVAREFVDRGMIADLNVHRDIGADGDPRGEDYRTNLFSVSGELLEAGSVSWGRPVRWNLPETAEPFVALPSREDRFELLSLHREGPSTDRHWWVGPILLVATALVAACLLWRLRLFWTGALLLGAALGCACIWSSRAPGVDFVLAPGDLVVDVFSPGGDPSSFVLDRAHPLFRDGPGPGRFLQNRVAIVDPSSTSGCRAASARPSYCAFERVAFLTAYYEAARGRVRADLLAIGIGPERAGSRDVAASRVGLGLLEEDDRCGSRVEKATGSKCFELLSATVFSVIGDFDGRDGIDEAVVQAGDGDRQLVAMDVLGTARWLRIPRARPR